MADLFETKGTLTVSIGEGYLSSFEVGILAPGDLVRTRRLAGQPVTLLYNGTPIATCEVVVAGAAVGAGFGVRVLRLEWPSTGGPEPGVRDDLVELLPTAIPLGSISVSLAELRGVGRSSIISLGKPFSEEEDAELLVAGMPVAAGKVVVVSSDEFGLKLTRVSTAAHEMGTVSSSGYLVRAPVGPPFVKDYDFKRPDRFSRSAVHRAQWIHQSFAQNVAARFRAALGDRGRGLGVAFVDQLLYEEACDKIAAGGKHRRLIAENVVGKNRPPDAVPGKSLVEEAGTTHPISACQRAVNEKLVSDAVHLRSSPVLIYSKGWERGPEEDEALVSCLRGAWRSVADMDIRIAPAGGAQSDPGIPKREVVLIVGIGRGREPFLYVVYPSITLEPFMGVLE